MYRGRIEGKLLAISFITVGELLFGAYKKNWGEKKPDLRGSKSASPGESKICR